MSRDHLGATFRVLRARDGISQREAAERAGLSHQFVSKAETGDTNMTLNTLSKLATSYRAVPVVVLCDGAEAAEAAAILAAAPKSERVFMLEVLRRMVRA